MAIQRPKWLVVVVVVVAATACSGGDASDDGVASLDDDATESATDEGAGGENRDLGQGEVEDAIVEFTRCLRDRGIDIPEPSGGDFTISSPSPDLEAEHPGYEEAYEACIPIVEEVTGSFEMSPEEIADFQDQQLTLARCMRERGYDYPDPQFGEDGIIVPTEPGVLDVPIDQYERDVEDCWAETGAGEAVSGDEGAEER